MGRILTFFIEGGGECKGIVRVRRIKELLVVDFVSGYLRIEMSEVEKKRLPLLTKIIEIGLANSKDASAKAKLRRQ